MTVFCGVLLTLRRQIRTYVVQRLVPHVHRTNNITASAPVGMERVDAAPSKNLRGGAPSTGECVGIYRRITVPYVERR